MQTVELKHTVVDTVINGKKAQGPLSTLDLIQIAIDSPLRGGFSTKEISERLRIRKVIDNLPESSTALQLEDADYQKLKQLVRDTKWGIVSEFIVEFDESFK